MSGYKKGNVDSAQTVKAGCGIRYDPDVLGDESGFDFSQAENFKPSEEQNKIQAEGQAEELEKSEDAEPKAKGD